jgi:RNA polymerase sigma-70 factor, ECF subfamily
MLINKSDEALVETYLDHRDERSFRELYRRHTPALYALALRLCGSEADAQDAVQDAWIRTCGTLSTFQWKSTLKTWLTGILINCAREQSRKRNRHPEEPLPDGWSGESTDAPGYLSLDQTIERLPDGYRHVLTLHDVEGYTHEEISALLDINIGTSKSQLHHARKAIRTLFLEEQSR